MTVALNKAGKLVLGSAVGTVIGWSFLQISFNLWHRIVYPYPKSPSPLFGDLVNLVDFALFCSGGLIFGMITGWLSRNQRALQVVIAVTVTFLALGRFSFLEGTFFPIVPVLGSVSCGLGAYWGHRLIAQVAQRQT